MEGWIKLHRKVLDNGILKDQMAWTIFSWLMLKVDRTTGKKITGRFWASQELGIKPITFYKGLRRLEKKWKVVTLRVTGKATEVSLINWHKYQSSNTSDNTSVTHEEHISNTLQEVENKELRREKDTSQNYLLTIPKTDLEEFTHTFICTDRQVISKGQQLYDYCQSNGKTYKDYKAFLRNALRKDFGDRIEAQQFKPNLPDEMSEEGLAKLKDMKEKILGKKFSTI